MKKNFKNKSCRIIDIGTGSGAIAISLLMEDVAKIEMTITDISDKALKLAQENFFTHKYSISPSHKVTFIKSDRLKQVPGTFDMILSNPPYIKEKADVENVHFQVKNFEPHLALFLPDEEYSLWFQEFFTSIYEKLSDQGISLIEGHESHLGGLADIAKTIGFKEAVVIQDYTQRNRFLKLKK